MKTSEQLNQELKDEIQDWTNPFQSFIEAILDNQEEGSESVNNSDTIAQNESESVEDSTPTSSGEHLG